MIWSISINMLKTLFVCFTDNSSVNCRLLGFWVLLLLKGLLMIMISFINHWDYSFMSLIVFEKFVIILECFNTLLSLCSHHSLGNTYYSPLSFFPL